MGASNTKEIEGFLKSWKKEARKDEKSFVRVVRNATNILMTDGDPRLHLGAFIFLLKLFLRKNLRARRLGELKS